MDSRSSKSLFDTVRSLPGDSSVVDRFKRGKLNVSFVKWEDTARSKGSCWGPNISDVTLDVNDKSFPIIGTDNWEDPTFDMSIDRFSVHVGNEVPFGTETLTRLSLKDYLQNIDKYVDAKINGPMFLPRDDKILTSAQSCILPLKDGKVPFNVRIHNYQYDSQDPAVLVVVVSPHGTSAQLVTEHKQLIYFNKCNNKAQYLAERLADVRSAAGKSTEGLKKRKNKMLFLCSKYL